MLIELNKEIFNEFAKKDMKENSSEAHLSCCVDCFIKHIKEYGISVIIDNDMDNIFECDSEETCNYVQNLPICNCLDYC